MSAPEDEFPFRIELDLREPPVRPRRAEAAPPTLFDGAEAQAVLAAARAFASDPERLLRQYAEDPETWGGAYISGDELLRMLPCRPARPWLSYALGGQVLGTFPGDLFDRRLARPAGPGERVLLTMGMPASGKTTLVKGGFGREFFAVVDTPLGNFELARELLRKTQASGRSASFVLAWRPLEQAAAGMLERAMPGHEERAVPLADMAETLVKGLDVFRRLAELNRHDGDTTLDLVRSQAGRRSWSPGGAAAAFLAGQRERCLGLPGGVLGQLVPAWRRAVARLEGDGAAIPAVLRAIAEDGVDPGAFPGTGAPGISRVEHGASGSPAWTVKSLGDLPGWRHRIPGLLADADVYEEALRWGR